MQNTEVLIGIRWQCFKIYLYLHHYHHHHHRHHNYHYHRLIITVDQVGLFYTQLHGLYAGFRDAVKEGPGKEVVMFPLF